MNEDQHPNFQREKFSKLPMTRTCNTCGELADIVVHAFCQGGHCEKRGCVEECQECQEWFTAIAPEEEEVRKPEPKMEKPMELKDRTDDQVRSTWLSFPVTEQEEEDAKKEWARIKKEMRGFNHLEEGYDRHTGILGEDKYEQGVLVAAGKLKGRDYIKTRDGKGYDGGIDFGGAEWSVDVKTANRNFYPQPHYSCEVNDEQKNNRKCGTYVFASYDRKARTLTIMGWMDGEKFDRVARKREKGTAMDGGTKTNAPMWHVEAKELDPIGGGAK